MDCILNNDGLKHNGDDERNETWTKLLQELNVYGGMNDEEQIQYLRNRFVFGASTWLAGENGSSENDKLNLGYTDKQWEFIWPTMAEDGAWAVPNITDNSGDILVQNFAPEMMIKFMAHDLKCHIIVFDMHLDIIQFCSGNRLKENNVVFDSPILLYSTGSHFQSVHPIDQEYFAKYAKQEDLRRRPHPGLDTPMNYDHSIPAPPFPKMKKQAKPIHQFSKIRTPT